MRSVDAECPACQSSSTRAVDGVDVRRLAAVWSANWPVTPAPDATVMAERICADLASETIGIRGCQLCGLEFADPMRTWTAGHYPSQSHGLGFDHARALDGLCNRPPVQVLEIGCGCGEFLKSASALGHQCLGIDFSVESVARAQAAGVNARVMDLTALSSWEDRPPAFDIVAMFQVIEHLEQPNQLFAEISGLVKPDSQLFVGCPSPTRFTRKIGHAHRVGSAEFWDYPPQHVLRWTPHSLQTFLDRHGWTVDSIEHEPFHILAAAAELVAIDGLAGGWYANPLRRRLSTLVRRAQLSALSLIQSYSGTRLFVRARRR